MTDPLRPTLPQVELKDAHIHPAPPGKRVMALNKGAVLCFTTVDKDFLTQFEAWCEFPTIPASVKERLANRHLPNDNAALVCDGVG